MLKRHQILLTDWLGEYARFITKVYDISFSEAVRILMCLGALHAISETEPKFNHTISIKKMFQGFKKMGGKRMINEDLFHRNISKIYFEARKAIEFRIKNKIKNQVN